VILAFDCAVSGLGVAVVRDGVRLAGLAEGGREQAARLMPAIAAVLAEAGVGDSERQTGSRIWPLLTSRPCQV